MNRLAWIGVFLCTACTSAERTAESAVEDPAIAAAELDDGTGREAPDPNSPPLLPSSEPWEWVFTASEAPPWRSSKRAVAPSATFFDIGKRRVDRYVVRERAQGLELRREHADGRRSVEPIWSLRLPGKPTGEVVVAGDSTRAVVGFRTVDGYAVRYVDTRADEPVLTESFDIDNPDSDSARAIQIDLQPAKLVVYLWAAGQPYVDEIELGGEGHVARSSVDGYAHASQFTIPEEVSQGRPFGERWTIGDATYVIDKNPRGVGLSRSDGGSLTWKQQLLPGQTWWDSAALVGQGSRIVVVYFASDRTGAAMSLFDAATGYELDYLTIDPAGLLGASGGPTELAVQVVRRNVLAVYGSDGSSRYRVVKTLGDTVHHKALEVWE